MMQCKVVFSTRHGDLKIVTVLPKEHIIPLVRELRRVCGIPDRTSIMLEVHKDGVYLWLGRNLPRAPKEFARIGFHFDRDGDGNAVLRFSVVPERGEKAHRSALALAMLIINGILPDLLQKLEGGEYHDFAGEATERGEVSLCV
jgi:hypothetical protein